MRRRLRLGATLSALTVTALIASGTPAFAQPGPFVGGSIRNEYNDAGGFAVFGQALDVEKPDRQGGKFQDFQSNNHIYWNARVDQNRGRQIGGAIFDKWAQTDYENGYLGYPTSREFSGGRAAKGNHFERGEIYWTSTFGARIVVGEIGETWKASGYENGPYGVPTSDEYDFDGGRRQDFEGGKFITWKPTFSEDVENENTISDFDCIFTSSCGGDDSVSTIGVYNFDTGQSGQRRATPENSDPEVAELEATAPAQAEEQLESELGEVAETCDPANPPTEEGTNVCYIYGEPTDPGFAPAPAESTEPPADPSTPPSATESSTPTETTVEPTPGTQSPSTTAGISPTGTEVPAEPTATSGPAPAACPTPTGTVTATPTPTPTPMPTPTTSGVPVCPPQTNEVESQPAVPASTSIGDEQFGFMPRPQRTAQIPFKHTECLDNDFSDMTQFWRGSRMYACFEKPGQFVETTTVNVDGVPVTTVTGRIGFVERMDVTPAYNSPQLQMRYSVRTAALLDIAGTPAAFGTGIGATLTGASSCVSTQSVCSTSTSGTLGAQTVGATAGSVDKLVNWTSTMNWLSGLRPSAITGFSLSATFKNASSRKTAPPLQSPRIRCDNDPFMRDRVGCTFPAAPAVLDYTTKANVASFTRHVRLAQQSGLPGKPGQSALNRIYNTNGDIDANRRASCGGITGPRNGLSCDEYPFASSDQGPRSTGPNAGGPGRTYDGCGDIKDDKAKPGITSSSGFSVCLIPQSENSRAGSLLSWFFTKNRVIQGDGFYIGAGA